MKTSQIDKTPVQVLKEYVSVIDHQVNSPVGLVADAMRNFARQEVSRALEEKVQEGVIQTHAEDSNLKTLYTEILQREEYLKLNKESIGRDARIDELNSFAVRVQQLILSTKTEITPIDIEELAEKFFEEKMDKGEGFDLKPGWRKIFTDTYSFLKRN